MFLGSGFVAFFQGEGWKNLVMIAVACVLIYLAIVKQYEPLLLLPIAFGMLLVNIPNGGIMDYPTMAIQPIEEMNNILAQNPGSHFQQIWLATDISDINNVEYAKYFVNLNHKDNVTGGLLYYLYQGVKLGIYPPLIFLGIGCMTDFGPLIANPKSFLLGAAAQLGIFVAFIGAILFGFDAKEAASIGIIGGADGPTAIYTTGKLAPDLLGPIAVAAYSYMALVPVIQPPIMKLLTTKKERSVVMGQLRPVSKTEKILFPILVTLVVCLLVPSATPLIGMLMLGNLFKESGVVDRLVKTAQNELMNIVTIFLGVTVGATANATTFLNMRTLGIIAMGLVAFAFGTAGGVLFGKLMYIFSKGKVNPLIGSAGVSAVPMAARVSQKVGAAENPTNFLLMHAMGPNVAGVIGSGVAAGVLISLFA
ncbi:MAG: sodium ion-translocating decarboxylase subunit beta [Massiliimalia sp.]